MMIGRWRVLLEGMLLHVGTVGLLHWMRMVHWWVYWPLLLHLVSV